MSESFYSLYQKSVAKTILNEAEKVIQSEAFWSEKYDLIFPRLSRQFFSVCPRFEYYDPDCSYEDDVLAWYNAAKDFATFNPEFAS